MKSTIKETKEMILDELNKAYENNPTKEIEKKLILFVENEIQIEIQVDKKLKKVGYTTLVSMLVSIVVWCVAFYFTRNSFFSVPLALGVGFLLHFFVSENMYVDDKNLANYNLTNYLQIKSKREHQKEKEAEQRLINEYLTPIKNPQGEAK